MLKIKGSAPSRAGKKQVSAFLRPNQAQAAYDMARTQGKTNQEVLGEAMNAVCAFHGLQPLVPSGHTRIVRRKSGRAEMRDGGNKGTPACRNGRISFAGFFDDDTVARLRRYAADVDMSVQSWIVLGIQLITGVAPEAPAKADAA